MLVYGLRCSPTDLSTLPTNATADYYIDYSLLVFPTYSKGLCLQTTSLSQRFWQRAKRVLQYPTQVSSMDFEQPWITDEEQDVVYALQEAYPGIQPDWYYVPKVVTNK